MSKKERRYFKKDVHSTIKLDKFEKSRKKASKKNIKKNHKIEIEEELEGYY